MMASARLIHSHSEDEWTDAGCAVADGNCECRGGVAAGCACAAGAGGLEAAATVLPPAGRMLSVRAGMVAVLDWLV